MSANPDSTNHTGPPGLALSDAGKKWFIPALLLIAIAGMTWISWLKWSDLIVDYGAEVYLTWQVAEGKLLYRDLAQIHGPLSIYLHAGVFQLFGPGIATLALFNILIVTGLAFLIYRFIRSSSDALTGGLCALVFITLFAFGQYKGGGNFNFIGPYLYELSHGVALSLCALYFFSKYIETKKQIPLVSTWVTTGLVFLTKPEVFLAILSAIASGTVAAFYLQSMDKKAWIQGTLISIGSFLAAPFLFFVYFWMHVPWHQALAYVASPWIHVFNASNVVLPFYQWVMGLNSPENNLIELFKYFVLGGFIVGLLTLLNRLINRTPQILSTLAIPLGLLAGGLMSLGVQQFNLLELLRPLPLMVGILIVVYAIQTFKNRRAEWGGPLVQLTFAAFALALLLKIILNVHVYHYGFALALPATLVVLRWALYALPHSEKYFSGPNKFYRSGMVLLILFIMSNHVLLGNKLHQLKNYPVGEGRDIMLDYDPAFEPRGPIVTDTLKYIRENIKPGTGIATMPAGNMINYMSRQPNPLRFHGLNPVEAYVFGEQRYLDDLKSIAPEYIMLVESDFRNLGSRYFGKDYAKSIMTWVREHYSLQKQFGAEPFTGQGFGVQLMRRNENDER